jgi:hypothetical protein
LLPVATLPTLPSGAWGAYPLEATRPLCCLVDCWDYAGSLLSRSWLLSDKYASRVVDLSTWVQQSIASRHAPRASPLPAELSLY